MLLLLFLVPFKTIFAADVRYLHTDHLGGIQVVTQKGRVDEIRDFTAFGEIRFDQITGRSGEQRGYIGEDYDPETDLDYLNARYYDPALKRFLTQDPEFWLMPEDSLLDPQRQNSYSYGRNNPVMYSDPMGLSSAIGFPVPQGGWKFGQKMGEFNGVAAYYNGIGSSRPDRSCVEYARRYASEVYGMKNIGPVIDAKTMWSMSATINSRLINAGSDYIFTRHENGGQSLPATGDLLFWTQGQYGHVMVVTESKFNTKTNQGYVEIIDQNASKQAVRALDVRKTDSGYTIMKNADTPVAGWFSPTPVREKSPAPALIPSQSVSSPVAVAPKQSWGQRIWNGAKNFIKKYF